MERARQVHPSEEVRALVRLLRRNVIGPEGQELTIGDIAALLGIGERTMKAYMMAPQRRNPNWRGIPYCTLFCLQALLSSPSATAEAVWPTQAP